MPTDLMATDSFPGRHFDDRVYRVAEDAEGRGCEGGVDGGSLKRMVRIRRTTVGHQIVLLPSQASQREAI